MPPGTHSTNSTVKRRLPSDCLSGRLPAGVALVSVASGILLGAACRLPSAFWLTGGVGGLIVFWIAFRKGRLKFSAGILLATIVVVAAGMTQTRLFTVASADISRIATGTPQPIHLIGRLADEPYVFEGAPPTDEVGLDPDDRAMRPLFPTDRPRTVMVLRGEELVIAGMKRSVSGMVRLETEGERRDLHAGDRVEVWGRLVLPGTPRNAGDFDFAEYLSRRGIRSIVRCRIPAEIRLLQAARGFHWQRFLRGQQEASIALLEKVVGKDQAPLAIAMLLGPRQQLAEDLRRAFSESGAAHLLAISGINVGILAAFLWFWGRLFNLRFRTIQWGMLLLVFAYLGITDASPPVVRAALLLGLSGFGQIVRRASSPLNGLCAAGILILLWNPANLFDIGAQLSFLAVLGLVTLTRIQGGWNLVRQPGLLEALQDLLPWWERAWLFFREQTVQIYLCTLAIWVFTQPLVLMRFQSLPALGFLATVLMTPLVNVVLWLGYLVLLAGRIPLVEASGVLAIPGMLLRWGLTGMEWGVRAVSSVPGGHAYVPGPAGWWLCGYYAVLVLLVLFPVGGVRWRWSLRAWGGWWLVGFVVLMWPTTDSSVRCTVLSVGHGGAVLVEFPTGQSMLYDCGAMGDPERVAQTVQMALLKRGKNRLDLVVLSHADADHFNGAVPLLRNLGVGEICVAKSFLQEEIPGIRNLVEDAARRGIPIRLIQGGDQWQVSDRVRMRVLHPGAGWNSRWDNANSIVLEVEANERKILLTGDLDRDGLQEVLKQKRVRYDMMMSPHHGGRTANPPELGAWADPEYVIISGGQPRFMGRLTEVYPTAARIFWTPLHGSVTTIVTQRGELAAEPFREGEFPPAIAGSRRSD